MDEGYIQTKQRELNEKIALVEQKITTIETKLDRKIDSINKIIDDFDALILALKRQDEFHDTLRQENQKNLNIFIDDAKKVILSLTQTIVVKELKQVLEISDRAREFVSNIDKDFGKLNDDFMNYLATFAVLMGILTRDGVITREEAEDIMSEVTRLKEITKKNWDKNKDKIAKLMSKMK